MADRFLRTLEVAVSRAAGTTSDFDLNREVDLPPDRTLRPAAVLMPFTRDGRLILTKRSSRLKHHPGQIALPGGKVDDSDTDAVDAALREAEEEIGLPRQACEVIGTLPTHETVTGFDVVPVVSIVDPPSGFVPEAGEVEEAFFVPALHVLTPGNFRIEGRMWRGQRRRYYTVPYGPYYIWGATARMLRALAEQVSDASD